MKIITAILLICSSYSNAQTYSLALSLQEAHAYYLGIQSDHHISGEWEGKKMDARIAMNGRVKCPVINVTDSGYEMEVSIDSMHLVMHGPMGKMEFSYPDSFFTQDMGFAKPIHDGPGKREKTT